MLLTIEAFDVNDDFIKDIKRQFNVEIVGSIENPYSVVFKGSKENLTLMFNEYWLDICDEFQEIDEKLLSEE